MDKLVLVLLHFASRPLHPSSSSSTPSSSSFRFPEIVTTSASHLAAFLLLSEDPDIWFWWTNTISTSAVSQLCYFPHTHKPRERLFIPTWFPLLLPPLATWSWLIHPLFMNTTPFFWTPVCPFTICSTWWFKLWTIKKEEVFWLFFWTS